jgi:hypothetical protein
MKWQSACSEPAQPTLWREPSRLDAQCLARLAEALEVSQV